MCNKFLFVIRRHTHPLDFNSVPRLPAKLAPVLGEHTDQILLEVLGMSEGEVGRLHDQGIVAGPV